MAKVTSKLQVTIPKRLAARYAIRPGDEIDWEAGGDAIRIVPRDRRPGTPSLPERLAIFDAATERIERRGGATSDTPPRDRGWTRDELYVRESDT